MVALLSVAATAGYGIIFSLVFDGSLSSGPFVTIAAAGVPLHAIAGLGGWLTFAAMGVSYRLLAMFMLAPELEGRRTRAVFYFGTSALAVAKIGRASGREGCVSECSSRWSPCT